MKKLLVLAVLGAFLITGQAFANKRGAPVLTGEDSQQTASKKPCIRAATGKGSGKTDAANVKKEQKDKKADGLE